MIDPVTPIDTQLETLRAKLDIANKARGYHEYKEAEHRRDKERAYAQIDQLTNRIEILERAHNAERAS